MNGARSQLLASLQALGLTNLESEVYACLLSLGRATGYRVAKETGRPTANVYKALDALVGKGAVLLPDGGEGTFAAVPARRFLRQERARFLEHEQAVIAATERSAEPEPAGIFALRTPEQLAERLESMVKDARRVLLVDASPAMLARWLPLLSQKRAGRRVLVKAYAPVELPGAEVAVDPRGAAILARWAIDWLHAVADGSELVLSAHVEGSLRRAVWTREPFVTVHYHEALVGEILLAGVMTRLGKGHAPLRRYIEHGLESVRLDTAGFERLFRQLGVRRPGTEEA